MDKEEKIELFLKGYEEGLNEAWSDIKNLVGRYEGWELKTRVESKIGTLYQEVESKRIDLEDNPEMLRVEEEEKTEEEKTEEEESEKGYDWEKHDSHLVLESSPKAGLNGFLTIVKDLELQGLFITRRSPAKLVEQYDIDEDGRYRYIWLSKEGGGSNSNVDIKGSSNSPSDLSNLSARMGEFMKEEDDVVLYLSGISYMLNFNKPEQVLHFMGWIKDKTQGRSHLVVSVNGAAVDEDFLEKLKGEFDNVLDRQ